eukprot:359028-Chlamydomonas_euryale.AAC.2
MAASASRTLRPTTTRSASTSSRSAASLESARRRTSLRCRSVSRTDHVRWGGGGEGRRVCGWGKRGAAQPRVLHPCVDVQAAGRSQSHEVMVT